MTAPDTSSIDGLYLALELDDAPGDERPFVYINMVASVDGKIAVEGSERGLGSDADKRLFYELRGRADAVLNGGTTARTSGSSPRVRPEDVRTWRIERNLPAHPIGVLITESGQVPFDGPFFTDPTLRCVVFASRSIVASPLERLRAAGRPVHLIPGGVEGIGEMLRVLRQQYDVRRLLCEGGGTVNAGMVRLGAADELFLTIAPKIVGGHDIPTIVEGAPFGRADMPPLDLLFWQHHRPTGEVFTRWRFRR